MSDVTSYDFDDVSEYFEFKLGGYAYQMRYPTTEEMEKAMDLDGDARGEFVLSFIKPVQENDPNVSDTLKKVTVKSSRLFIKTVMKEFSSAE